MRSVLLHTPHASPAATPRLLRAFLWPRLDAPSIEHFRFAEGADGPRLAGTVIAVHEGLPLRVEYEIACSCAWETRRVRVEQWHGAQWRHLEITVDETRRWWLDGRELAAVRGCVDVDLSVSPSTNALPVRRLALPVGAAEEVTAAWLRFPRLTVEPLRQCYRRVGERLYRYESRGGAFTADIAVDDLGLVVSYPPAWERVADAGVRIASPVGEESVRRSS